MMNFTDPFAHWEGFRSNAPEAARRAGEAFVQAFAREHHGYSTMIRPAFPPLAAPSHSCAELETVTLRLIGLLRDAVKRLLGGGAERLSEMTGLSTDEAEHLLAHATPANMEAMGACARADYILTASGPRLVEMNSSAAIGGIGILGRYDRVMSKVLSATGGEAWREGVADLKADACWVAFVRASLHGRHSPPRVAVMCLPDELDIPPPIEAGRVLVEAGFDVSLVSIDDVQVAPGVVRAAGNAVDAVYGCLTLSDLRRPGVLEGVNTLVLAQADGLATYYLPPLAGLLGSKALLAELCLQAARGGLATADAALIREFVPETRLLSPKTRSWAIERREELVLKPSIGHSGKDVTFGARLSKDQWRAALEDKVSMTGGWVLQKACRPLDVFKPQAEGVMPHNVVLGALSFNGKGAGILARVQPSIEHEPINCSHGSGFAPCYALRH